MLAMKQVQIFEKTKEDNLLDLLSSLKIKVNSVSLDRKEYVDTYELTLAHGERTSRLDRVLGDIGLALKAHAHPTRIIDMSRGIYTLYVQKCQIPPPIFSDSYKSLSDKQYIPLSLGTDSHNRYLNIDLSKAPNLLIAGTTGSGKSILLHNFILSMIGRGTAVYLSDPKMVEFTSYNGVKNVEKVVHSAEDTIEVIKELTRLMESRFKTLQKVSARNAKEYNDLTNGSGRKKMSPTVLVVDEWADLTLQNKSIQKDLCLLAQKGRAAGISIILATQRPSASVVSGLIKANFPARIALKVASAVDSRVILDTGGAEKISGVGTGLYLDGTLSEPKLFRAPYIGSVDSEIESMNLKKKSCSFWKRLLR